MRNLENSNPTTFMEYRLLGGSGFKVPELTLGTGTFGGANELFRAFGSTGVEEATRLVDICLEAGLTMFDSADVYSAGLAIPFLITALALNSFLRFYQRFRRYLHAVEVGSGALLLFVGGLIFLDRLTWLSGKLGFLNRFVR